MAKGSATKSNGHFYLCKSKSSCFRDKSSKFGEYIDETCEFYKNYFMIQKKWYLRILISLILSWCLQSSSFRVICYTYYIHNV